MARASAASYGRGGSRKPSRRAIQSDICSLSAAPNPAIARLTVAGVYSKTAARARAAHTSATPRPSPIRMAEAELFPTKTCSIAISAGACSATMRLRCSWIKRRRSCTGADFGGEIASHATNTFRFSRQSITPTPTTRVPGSMARMRTVSVTCLLLHNGTRAPHLFRAAGGCAPAHADAGLRRMQK